MARFFGTNGIRMLYCDFSPEFVSRMCNAFAQWSGSGPLVLARDTRVTGEAMEHAAEAGLLEAGKEVLRLGVAPSPCAEWNVLRQGAAGAVVITASHNPPEWNALKFVDGNGIAVSKERGEEIEKIFELGGKRAEWNSTGRVVQSKHLTSDYVSAVASSARVRKKLDLVLDCANGTACAVGPHIFKKLGCGVQSLNSHPDGFFPGRNSEPTEPNIQDLVASVRETGADAGIAWDGDCDRVVFVDEKGGYVIGDKVFSLCAKIKLEKQKGRIISTVSTTRAVEDMAKLFGQRVEYCKVGAPYISERMRETGAVLGGEEVGGVIWPEFHWGKDGFYTAAKVVERIAQEKRPLSEIISELPRYYNVKTKIPCPPERKQAVMQAMLSEARQKGKQVLSIDGVRIDEKDAWVIARASGTENFIRVFAEAKSEQKAVSLMKEYEALARSFSKA